MLFKSFVVVSVLILQSHSVWACEKSLPAASDAIRIDEFSLGSCWVKEALQELTKKPNGSNEKLVAVLSEMIRYIPTPTQRSVLVNQLTSSINSKSPAKVRDAVLAALGNLHLLTPEARRTINEAMADKNSEMRKAGLLAASAIAPKDDLLQQQILNAVLRDPVNENRYVALSGVFRRSSSAIATLTALAKSSKDEILQANSQQILDDWQAHPEPKVQPTQAMATLGDSISVGFFADTNLLDAAQYNVDPKDVGVLWFLAHSSRDEQMKRSWSSGEKVHSHFSRLKEQLRASGKSDDVEIYNVARAGAKTNALLDQIWQLDLKMALNPDQRLIYVTLWMGSNDVCDGTNDDTMAEEVSRALDRLNRLALGGKIVVLVPSLPPIHKLGTAKMAGQVGLAGLTCERLQQDKLRFCNRYTSLASPSDYLTNKAMVDSANQKLADVVANANRFENLQLVLGKSLKTADLGPELMALDCFHPNESGQEGVAEILWTDVMSADITW